MYSAITRKVKRNIELAMIIYIDKDRYRLYNYECK